LLPPSHGACGWAKYTGSPVAVIVACRAISEPQPHVSDRLICAGRPWVAAMTASPTDDLRPRRAGRRCGPAPGSAAPTSLAGGARGTQPDQLPGRRRYGLGVDPPIDRLVRHPARLVGGVLGRQPARDRGRRPAIKQLGAHHRPQRGERSTAKRIGRSRATPAASCAAAPGSARGRRADGHHARPPKNHARGADRSPCTAGPR
jgi:hypothetical protein